MATRNINLTDALDRFVAELVQSGSYQNASERDMAEMSAKFKDVGSEIYVHPTGEKRAPID
jgi:hypothetical protein